MNMVLVNFFNNVSEDGMPTAYQVLNADYDWLEANHNWCQRAFPNFEHSAIVPDAPVLDNETLSHLRSYRRELALLLVFKMMKHYSFLSFDRVAHNNRRVTRMLKFLKMLRLDDVAATCHYQFSVMLKNHMLKALSMPDSPEDIILESFQLTKQYWATALAYKQGDSWIV